MPPGIVPETRRAAPEGLPDGLIATHPGGDVTAAWYTAPTTRYDHGILGDAIEAGALNVRTARGQELSYRLPETEVFEDRYPRLADLDGDGTVEVVTIRSSLTAGASVTIYGIEDHRLVEHATTGFIGKANRWLNIAGIAAFDGGKALHIAFVRTPHIGGTLYIHRFDGKTLTAVASAYGFSNHVIGAREMRLSALADVDGDGMIDLVLPSDDRNSLRIMALGDDELEELAAIRLPHVVDKAIAITGSGAALAIVVGLANGSVHRITRH